MLWRLSKLKYINIVRLNYLIPSFDKRICSKLNRLCDAIASFSLPNRLNKLYRAMNRTSAEDEWSFFFLSEVSFSKRFKSLLSIAHSRSEEAQERREKVTHQWWTAFEEADWKGVADDGMWRKQEKKECLCWCELFVFDGNSKRHYLSQQNDYFDGTQSCSDVHRWGRTVRTKFLLLCDIALYILKHELSIINRRNNTHRKACLLGRKCSFKIQNFYWIFKINFNE